MVSYMTSMLLLIGVAQQLEYMGLTTSVLGFDPHWKFHVDVHFYGSLDVFHYEVNFSETPSK